MNTSLAVKALSSFLLLTAAGHAQITGTYTWSQNSDATLTITEPFPGIFLGVVEFHGEVVPGEGFVVAVGPDGVCGTNSNGSNLCITEIAAGLEIEMTSGPRKGRTTTWNRT